MRLSSLMFFWCLWLAVMVAIATYIADQYRCSPDRVEWMRQEVIHAQNFGEARRVRDIKRALNYCRGRDD